MFVTFVLPASCNIASLLRGSTQSLRPPGQASLPAFPGWAMQLWKQLQL